MESKSHAFKERSSAALHDRQLQKALGNVRSGFIDKRAKARAALPEFDDLRDRARDIKDHVLGHLDVYLERYERKVTESGGHVHWGTNNRYA
jgi:L-lactate dehydrogenase complex protein LldF